MSYAFHRTRPNVTLEQAEARAREALSAVGFGVMTEIDVSAALKNKLGVDISGYRILGACNPNMAHKAISVEPHVGVMLPCNVILREVSGGVEVSAIDPLASMTAIDNSELREIAGAVGDMLKSAVDAI